MTRDIALRKILQERYEMNAAIISLLTRYNIEGANSKWLYEEIVKACRRYEECMSAATRELEDAKELIEQYGLPYDAEKKIFNYIVYEWGSWYQH